MNATRDAQARRSRDHRLHALCPYYAMFPPSFAREAILRLTNPGDIVLDPFCGRGTTVLEALLHDRPALGIDINPVAALVSGAKADPPCLARTLSRIAELEASYRNADMAALRSEALALPKFFRAAYSPTTLRQLLFLRRSLSRGHSRVDSFIRALLLGHLHGESTTSTSYLSNQLPHTISPKPDYSLRYWTEHNLRAPRRDAFELLRSRAGFRLSDGIPHLRGHVIKSDVRAAATRLAPFRGKVNLLITSPPYFDVTRYEEDQWLRLWFLGGEPHPTYGAYGGDDRHRSKDRYFAFLRSAWSGLEPLVGKRSHLLCRISSTRLSLEELDHSLTDTIRAAWPHARKVGKPAPTQLVNSQTDIIRPGAAGCRVEYDFRFLLQG